MSMVPLGDVAEIERDGIAPENIVSGTLYLGLEHIESGGRIISNEPVVSGELASTKFQFTDEHVLFGKLRPYLAKIALPDFSGICSTDIVPIRPGPKLDRRFLAYFLRQPAIVEKANNLATGANLPRLSPKALASIEIPLLRLDEQKRIAAILDQADELRRKRQQALTRLNQLGRAIFIEMFGDPRTNPNRYPIKHLGELVTNEDGKRVPVKLADRDSMHGEYPYYGASGIIDYVDDYLFDGERLLIGEDGANLLARSSPLAFIARGKFWVNNHAHVLAYNGKASLKFLEFFIEATDISSYVSGSAQPKLTQKQLNAIPVPTPPILAQEQFAERLSAVEIEQQKAAQAQRFIEAIFTSLQHRAFTGQLTASALKEVAA